MKRTFIFLIFLLGIAQAVEAVQDTFGTERPALWRSTRTATQDSFVLVTSPTSITAKNNNGVHFHGVIIGSATLNIADSRVIIYNSTSVNVRSVNASTAAIIDLGNRIYRVNAEITGSTAAVVIQAPRAKIEYNIFLSSGFVYDKRGNADINMLWDYINPKLRIGGINSNIAP